MAIFEIIFIFITLFILFNRELVTEWIIKAMAPPQISTNKDGGKNQKKAKESHKSSSLFHELGHDVAKALSDAREGFESANSEGKQDDVEFDFLDQEIREAAKEKLEKQFEDYTEEEKQILFEIAQERKDK